MTTPLTLEQLALSGKGADLVLEGGGVKGIGLAGAVIALSQAGYVFPRVGGTSAGAIVAALVAAYQTKNVPLTQLHTDMQELEYPRFEGKSFLERHLGLLGTVETLVSHQGMYTTDYLDEWLHSKLDPIGVHTFADLKITTDSGTGLPPTQRYRLVVHTSDLTRQALVRLPWDLPAYRLRPDQPSTLEQQIAVIDDYPVVDAVRASMSIPFFFRPFEQVTALGTCTWVDGGLLQNFPVTVFDRTDGKPDRWPTFGIKLSSEPATDVPDRPVVGDAGELMAIVHTALGEWNRYALADDGVSSRTIWVNTMNVSSTNFNLDPATQDALYANGQAAVATFLRAWEAIHPVPAAAPAA